MYKDTDCSEWIKKLYVGSRVLYLVWANGDSLFFHIVRSNVIFRFSETSNVQSSAV